MGDNWKHLLNFRCTCCGDCCREPIVLLTDEDVRRVMKYTGQAAPEVASFYKPDEIDWGLENDGWVQFSSGPHIMGLIRSEDGCQYLQEDDRCGIYEHRPVTCRRYPFDVEFDENEELSLLSISDSVECPYELDGQNSPEQIVALCEWETEEEEPYFELVRSWNAKSKRGGPKRFFAHLGLA